MSETTSPLVGIVMGSDSDWPKIKAAAAALDEFGVPYEVRVMSAHRTPEIVRQYATMAAARGLKVIIAAAGGAAHLAGVVASHTTLPVIGIPVPTELSGGLDSLLSIVQMPGDVPVATVGVGGGGPRNAGLLAVQILALGNVGLQEKLTAFKHKLAEKVGEKDAALQETLRNAGSSRTRERRSKEKKNSRELTAPGGVPLDRRTAPGAVSSRLLALMLYSRTRCRHALLPLHLPRLRHVDAGSGRRFCAARARHPAARRRVGTTVPRKGQRGRGSIRCGVFRFC